MRKTVRYSSIILFSILITLLPLSLTPSAEAIPNVYIYPKICVAEPGDLFTLSIKITGAIDVFAWEAHLSWNASVLNVTNMVEGNFFQVQPKGSYFVKKAYEGNLTVASTTIGYYSGVSGSGTLAQITFMTRAKGETPLELFDTKLRNSALNPIEHTTVDGLFTNTAGIPIASFTYSPEFARIDEEIIFNATSSHDPDGTIVRYFWDFGDGSNATETDPIATHAYAVAGPYEVTLNVTDNTDFFSIVTKTLKVRFNHDLVVTSVQASAEDATAGDTVQITVTVKNDGVEDESPVSVIAYYDDTAIGSAQTITTLLSAQDRTITFDWNTQGVAPGDHRIKAVATAVTGETSIADNTFVDGTVTIKDAPQFPWIYVIAGVVVVVVVIVAAFFFLRRRKK